MGYLRKESENQGTNALNGLDVGFVVQISTLASSRFARIVKQSEGRYYRSPGTMVHEHIYPLGAGSFTGVGISFHVLLIY